MCMVVFWNNSLISCLHGRDANDLILIGLEGRAGRANQHLEYATFNEFGKAAGREERSTHQERIVYNKIKYFTLFAKFTFFSISCVIFDYLNRVERRTRTG